MTKLKDAKIKHAEARGEKKHAGRTASMHANDQTYDQTETCQNQTCQSTRKEETCRKHAQIKHAEARGKKKHAGMTASLHTNDQT